MIFVALTLCVPATWVMLILCYLKPLLARWREPVLQHPVLVLESDDWGAGPESQAEALDSIAETLACHRDASGAPAVMTLGLVLACPRASATPELVLETLQEPSQAANLSAIRAGIRQGVFSPQLHGMCHFEPTVIAGTGMAWPVAGEAVWTETLPDALQSSLVDGRTLPTQALPFGVVEDSIRQQADLWQTLFGTRPQVAVPTTFIWTDAAEQAWRKQGVRWLVTPGRRATRRDEQGRPSGVDRQYLAGQRTDGGLMCLVRDVYFEPARGHDPVSVVAATRQRFALGRSALIEIHRGNFVGPAAAPDSLAKLEIFLAQIRRTVPDIRFVSSASLGAGLASGDPAWVLWGLRRRLPFFVRRTREIPGFRRLARYSGLGFFMDLTARLVQGRPKPP